MTDEQEQALQRVLDLTRSDCAYREAQASRLAIMWPSLAAGLADLLAAHELPIPRPLHTAATVLRGEAQMPAGDAGSGAWCFCAAGGNAGGRGHLKGEGGCSRWCGCQGAAYPHLHDGTMPGNPVVT